MAAPRDESRRAELIRELSEARANGARASEIVELAAALKVAAGHGGFLPALREALPDQKNLPQYLRRKKIQVQKAREAKIPPRGPIGQEEMQLYQHLLPIAGMGRAAQALCLAELATATGLSERVLRAKMWQAVADGLGSLARKSRADRGRSRSLPPEIQQAFLARRLDPAMGQERITSTIRHLRGQFPDLEATDNAFYRVARSIPRAVLMTEREQRAHFDPTERWEVPYPNHTWVFDFTQADFFVWDRDPHQKPYRPWLIAIVDEHTRSCLYGLYVREAPSTAELQAVLLHAMLPKTHLDPKTAKQWIQCGIPEHLHCDNGKVQGSAWLKQACQTLGSDLGISPDVRHAPVRSPWHQGHIERFYGVVHLSFEAHVFSAAYCGRDPQHRREGFKGNIGRPRDWEPYPTLEAANYAFQVWTAAEYHRSPNRSTKWTPLEAWTHYAPGHVKVADEEYLRQALMQRAGRGGKRRARRGMIQLDGRFYSHPILQGYDGVSLSVRWDPADFDQILVYGLREEFLCEAARVKIRNVDNPKDIAEARAQKREKRAYRRSLRDAVQAARHLSDEEFQRHREQLVEAREREERESREGLIPMPVAAKRLAAEESGDDEPFIVDGISIPKENSQEKVGPYGMSKLGG